MTYNWADVQAMVATLPLPDAHAKLRELDRETKAKLDDLLKFREKLTQCLGGMATLLPLSGDEIMKGFGTPKSLPDYILEALHDEGRNLTINEIVSIVIHQKQDTSYNEVWRVMTQGRYGLASLVVQGLVNEHDHARPKTYSLAEAGRTKMAA